ncbi:MAG TPA: hypothetical protein ENN69_07320, partial [Spirochaetia bacterium]|nr:hypothetical protein [Spirochaetia bacterium]
MAYRNFATALYLTVHDMRRITDLDEFAAVFSFLEHHVSLNKVYLETYRAGHFVEEGQVRKVKDFFTQKGIAVSGGITPNVKGEAIWDFKSCCFTDPEQLAELRKVVVFTAGLFDEIILDDFYFNNCKCGRCIKARGEKSWSDFRTELAAQVTKTVFLAPARKTNPNVKMIIKYPNWYEHYQGTGYNLKDDSAAFDFI